jgi:hypothetical protein
MNRYLFAIIAVFTIAACGALAAEFADEIEFPEGTVEGILTGTGEDFVWVKADTAMEAVRFRAALRDGKPNERLLETFAELPVHNRVKLTWRRGDVPEVSEIELIEPDTRRGTVTGVVTDKGNNWIEITPEKAPPERYMPEWLEKTQRRRAGLDGEMLRILSAVEVGNKVEVRWLYDERKRILKLKFK